VNFRELIPWKRNDSKQQVAALYREDDRNPFLSLQRDVNRLFDDVFRSFERDGLPAVGTLSGFGPSWPSVEISETDKQIKVTAEIAGLDEKDIEILIEDGVLTLRGEKNTETKDKDAQFSERFFGRFERHIPLGTEVVEDNIDARFKNGVLTIVLPKSELAQARVRRIPIKT